MSDIELRLHKDMLVLSAPVDAVLERQGIVSARDRQYLNLMEPEVMRDAFRMEQMAGAHCLVTATEDITRARLAHMNMDDADRALAQAALSIAAEVRPQHILAEVGPCGLPLDASSKASLNENRSQYADAARAFGDEGFDAFFLNGFVSIADLKCALMGVAQVSGKPVFASMVVGATCPPCEGVGAERPRSDSAQVIDDIVQAYPLPAVGFEVAAEAPAPPVPASQRTCLDPSLWPEAVDAMADLGAAVVGFETADSIDQAVRYAQEAVERTDLPVLAQLRVSAQGASGVAAKGLVPLEDMDEYTPDTMELAAVRLYGAGVQFLRATGMATPAFTGALAATVQGLDVHR